MVPGGGESALLVEKKRVNNDNCKSVNPKASIKHFICLFLCCFICILWKSSIMHHECCIHVVMHSCYQNDESDNWETVHVLRLRHFSFYGIIMVKWICSFLGNEWKFFITAETSLLHSSNQILGSVRLNLLSYLARMFFGTFYLL